MERLSGNEESRPIWSACEKWEIGSGSELILQRSDFVFSTVSPNSIVAKEFHAVYERSDHGAIRMDEAKLLSLKPELDAFLDRYAPLFGPSPNALHARRFVQGLLKGGERRNAENIAQAMDGGSVRNLQAFLTTGAWDAADVLSEVRIHLIEHLAEPDAVWNSDETGRSRWWKGRPSRSTSW